MQTRQQSHFWLEIWIIIRIHAVTIIRKEVSTTAIMKVDLVDIKGKNQANRGIHRFSFLCIPRFFVRELRTRRLVAGQTKLP